MEYINESEDILSRLGIIQSTLECPKKKLSMKVNMKSSTANPGSSNPNLSTEDSSDDCLFENERFAQNRKRRRSQSKTAKKLGEGDHRYSRWHILGLICAFALIGLSSTVKDLSMFNMPPNNNNYTSTDRVQFFTHFSSSSGLSYLVGCLLAGCIFARLNTFAMFLCLMLISVPFTSMVIWQSFSTLSFNWVVFIMGVLLAAIERGGLLTSSLSHNYQRIFFCMYAAMALGSLVASLLMANTSMVALPENMAIQAVTKSLAKREVPVNIPGYIVTTTSAPTTSLPQWNQTVSMPTNLTSASPTNISTTTANPNELVFKTKTEENAIMRKEAERRRKEKEEKDKLEALKQTTVLTTTTPIPTTSNSTTTLPTTTTTPPTTTPTTTVPTTTSTTPTTTTTTSTTLQTRQTMGIIPAKVVTSATEGNMSGAPWNLLGKWPNGKGMAMFHPNQFSRIMLTVLMCVLILPLALGFCCCQLSTSVGPDTRLNELLAKARERVALDMEPLSCRILSASLWAVHATLETLLLLCLPLCSHELLKGLQIVGSSQPSVLVHTLVWFPATFVRLFFVIRPSLGGSSANIIHLFYSISISIALLLQFFMPMSEAKMIATVLALGLFSFTLPLMIYSWMVVFLEGNPLHMSGRFLVSTAVGKMLGPYAFTWMADSPSGHKINSLYIAIVCLLIASHVLFFFLSSNVHKAKRHMQIIQLSGAINGKSQPSTSETSKTGRSASRSNGQYKALLDSGEEDIEEMEFVLSEANDDDSDSDRNFV